MIIEERLGEECACLEVVCVEGLKKPKISLELLGFLDFVHRPVFYKTRKHNVSESGSVCILNWGGEKPTKLGPLESANLSYWTLFLRDPTE
jgi:hypothetical protein